MGPKIRMKATIALVILTSEVKFLNFYVYAEVNIVSIVNVYCLNYCAWVGKERN